jgi:hypothetical protein
LPFALLERGFDAGLGRWSRATSIASPCYRDMSERFLGLGPAELAEYLVTDPRAQPVR